MGMFSGLFGGGGGAERAAEAAAAQARAARDQLRKDTETYQGYYTPYMEAGNVAAGNQNAVLGGVQSRINAIDPKIAALYAERAGLQPQVGEIYSLSKQQDPILQEILGGGKNFTADPGYQFRLEEGQKALERSRAANRTLNTGETGKALMEYGQGMGSQEYGNYMNRLYSSLNAINTQLGGRGTALNAGQNQINSGVNLLGADMEQVNQQQQLAQQYQALINSGMSAADASARLGLNSSQVQAGITQGIGETYASGMQAHDAQMKAAGDQWLATGAAVAGAMAGGPAGAAMASNTAPKFSGVGQQQFLGTTSTPWANPDNMSYPATDASLPWKNPNVAQAAQIGSQSGFKSRYPTLGGY